MPKLTSSRKRSAAGGPSWLETVRDLTLRLVAVPSVSPGAGEIAIARLIREALSEGGLSSAYAIRELVPIPGDPHKRMNVVAMLEGQRREAVVLLGHFDTVGIEDYGALAPIACDPAALAEHRDELLEGVSLEHPDEWMFGRGALDMKSGIAAHMAVMRSFAEHALRMNEKPPLTIVFVATPDEEMQSAGALAASGVLARLRADRDLRYVGLINADYASPRIVGDPERPIYTGTIGKLLPMIYVVGKATHVGDAWDGLDADLVLAEIVRELSMNPAFADRFGTVATPPPVTLHAGDLKASYNVQTPWSAWLYLNVLTLMAPPDMWLTRLRDRSQAALDDLLARLRNHYIAWKRQPDATPPEHLRSGRVLTYADLVAALDITRPGSSEAVIADVRRSLPADLDPRLATLRIVEALWQAAGLHGPAAVIAFAPPYYPHIAGGDTLIAQAAQTVAERHSAEGLVVRPFYPFLSDLSYMLPTPGGAPAALTANMPLWSWSDAPGPQAAYSLPFADIDAAGIEGIVNVGPFGVGAHQRGERLLVPYSCGVVPQVICDVIAGLAERIA
jgi:arginine utilization protein RocB